MFCWLDTEADVALPVLRETVLAVKSASLDAQKVKDLNCTP